MTTYRKLTGEVIEFKLVGYIGRGTHSNKSANHFMDEDGNIVCKTKCLAGFDGHTVIKFVSIDEFYTEQYRKEFWRNNFPLRHYINCKKCQAIIESKLSA